MADVNKQSNEFLGMLQERLMGNSGIVSSQTTPLDTMINDTIAGLQTGQAAREAGTKASFERSRIDTQAVGESNLLTSKETTRNLGAASSMAVFNQVEEKTSKALKDLDLREREALATGQIEVADKIANLKLQQIQFQQEAQQKTFTNLMSAYNVVLNQRNFETEQAFKEKQMSQTERNNMATIATNYGIKLEVGDTLESVIARATPLASQKQQLEFAKLKSEINRANAETAKALKGDSSGLTTAGTSIDIYANTLSNLPAGPERDSFIASLQKNPEVYARVKQKMTANATHKYTDEELRDLVKSAKNNGATRGAIDLAIASDSTIVNKDRAYLILKESFETKPTEFNPGARKPETSTLFPNPVGVGLDLLFGK